MLKVTYLPQNMFFTTAGQPCKRDACLAPLFSFLSYVSLSSRNTGPKKVLTIFVLEEQTSNLDQGMGVLVCGLQAARIAL